MVKRAVGHVSGGREPGVGGGANGHGTSSYGIVVGVTAMSAVLGAWLGERPNASRIIVAALMVSISVGFVSRSTGHDRRVMVAVTVVAMTTVLITGARSHHEWAALASAPFGTFEGRATVVTDPDPIGRGTAIVFGIDGHRYEALLYGRLARTVSRLEVGRNVWLSGERVAVEGARGRRLGLRHIVGRLRLESIDVESLGVGQRGIDLAANRVRRLMRDGARHLPEPRDELFAGLVYGDDRAQPADMIERFRASGLAHLTAVSGQNVVYLLTVCGPLLRRLRRWWRLLATTLVLGWFVLLTRAEPSVIRAATMAGVAATGFAIGGRHRTADILAVSVALLVMVDPFLVWSVGWWMSVGGTAGLVHIAPALIAMRTDRGGRAPGAVVETLIATMSAQIGVLPVSLAVFGWPNALSIVCNLVAAPVAGFVMLIGIPASMTAGGLPDVVGRALMRPVDLLVWWVDRVAALGQSLRPPMPVDVAVTVSLVIAVVGPVIGRSVSSLTARRRSPRSHGHVPTLGHGRVPLSRGR